jgi:hypothetical protein
MVVGVQVIVLPFLVSHDLQPPIGDHLVGHHVGGRAGTALEHIHGELVVQPAGQQFIAGVADGLHFLFVQHPQLAIGLGGGLLDKRQGLDHVFEILDEDAGDGKVLHGPQGLHPVVYFVGQFPFPQRIVLGAEIADQLRGTRAGDPFGSHAQPVADTRGHPGDNAVELVRLFLPKGRQGRLGDLPDSGAVAGKRTGGMGLILQKSAFSDQGPGSQYRQMPGGTVESAHDGDFPLDDHAGPLAGG